MRPLFALLCLAVKYQNITRRTPRPAGERAGVRGLKESQLRKLDHPNKSCDDVHDEINRHATCKVELL